MGSLQIAFRYLIDSLRTVKQVRALRVLDEGALLVNLSQPTFDEDIVIYLLAGELSVDFIKKSLNVNTRADIHTLFILSLDLISDNGKTVEMSEGLRLLLDAYGGMVYAYKIVGQRVTISPISIDDAGKLKIEQPVNLAHLGGDYSAIDSKYIRGVRKIAGFTDRQFHSQSTSSHQVYNPLHAYYEVLGVSNGASLDEIKRAYRKKARQHHPDRDTSAGATARMQAINDAYAKILARFEEA